MTLRFGPDDAEAFNVARDDLVDRFERTSAGRDLGWVASGVLDFKWGYIGEDLTEWTPDDVGEILLGLYPAKAMVDPEDLDRIPTGFGAFLLFLGDEGIMSAVDAKAASAFVEHLRPHFHAAALDEANWSMGKRLMTTAHSEHVDMTDPDALQRFMEEFNSRPFDERDAILGPSAIAEGLGGGEGAIEPLPPIVLPPLDELEAAARNTVWWQRVRRLVEFVGDGRPLTDTGKLKLADGEVLVDLLETGDRFNPRIGDRVYKTKSTVELIDVHLTFLIAVETGVLTIEGRKVLPGPEDDPFDDVLESYYGMWLILFQNIGPTQYHYERIGYGFGWFAEEVDQLLPVILVELYRSDAESIDGLIESLWTYLLKTFDLGDSSESRLDLEHESVGWAFRRVLDRLAGFGSVAIEDVVEIDRAYGSPERSGGTVALTPLGMWTVQRFASRVTSAPIVGGLREAGVHELLAAASDLPEGEATAEVDAWVDHHGSAAAPLLVEALDTADETGRGIAFRALLRIGLQAADAVDALANDPELDHYVTIWRIDTLTGTATDMDCGGDADRFVRLLGGVIELWGPEAAVSAWAGPAAETVGLPAMLERAWRVDRPETEVVLAAIGAVHPDKTVAKAARKALFKYRSAR
jgi:hypothetical protein